MITLVDTTLRDGEQAPGVMFKDRDRCEIALLLDRMGVPELEVRSPVYGGDELASLRRLMALQLSCRLTGWCRLREGDLDAAAAAGLTAVHVSLPSSTRLLNLVNRSCDWLLEQVHGLLPSARRQFRFLSVGLQDASRTEPADLRRLAQRLADLGVDRIRLADTVGCWDPFQVHEVFRELHAAVPGAMFGFHGHNDLGMATANSLAAIRAGAGSVDVTVNGLGERAGNAALEQVVVALRLAFQCDCGINTGLLMKISRLVVEAARRPIPPSQPVVGSDVFTHESGIHVWGVARDPRTYLPFEPEQVGQPGTIIRYGKHSGRAAIRHALGLAAESLDSRQLDELRGLIRGRATAMGRSLTAEEVQMLCAGSVGLVEQERK